MSHDYLEIILTWRFDAQEIFLIFIAAENGCAASYFCGNQNACFFDSLEIQNSITVIYCQFDVFNALFLNKIINFLRKKKRILLTPKLLNGGVLWFKYSLPNICYISPNSMCRYKKEQLSEIWYNPGGFSILFSVYFGLGWTNPNLEYYVGQIVCKMQWCYTRNESADLVCLSGHCVCCVGLNQSGS